jgi:outer membrane protein assembly factor BamB
MNMTQWSKSLVAGVVLLGAISGCSSNDDEIKIAPLPLIQASVDVNVDWERSVGDGTQDYFSKLAPVVAYDKVFASDRHGVVAAFDAQTGKLVWEVEVEDQGSLFSFSSGINAQLSGGISAGYDKIIIGAESGMLYVLAQETGELVWKIQVDGEILAAPLLTNNKVIVAMGNGKINAFDINDGQELWSYQQDVPALTLRGISGLVESQGAAFFGLPNGKIGGVLVEDGRAIWEAIVTPQKGGNELASIIDIDSTPIALGETMYGVGYNGNLAAIEMRTGKVLWKRDYSAFKAMTVDGFNLYLTTTAGHVVAIDRRSGLERWSQLGLENRDLTAPVVFDGYVAVVDFEGVLHLLSQETGEFVGQQEIDDDGHIAKPIVDGKQLYLQSKDGLLSAISIK